jgi:menaquinone-dependent protoporphyrinogen oxidase
LEKSIEKSLESPSTTSVEDDRAIHPKEGLRVLVAYASKAGSTKGIAEFIGEKLGKNGTLVDVSDVGSASDLDKYDAFVIGSALYMFHWMKEANQFVSKNRQILSSRPVWIFSSGPTGTKPTDKKGRDLRVVSGPKEIEELRESINPRDHHVFFGAFYPDRIKGATGWFSRFVPKEDQGDFRNWSEIEAWTNNIADTLSRPRPV